MRGRIVAGGACWIFGPLAWFVGQGVAQAAWEAPYSTVTDYVSDLGAVTCGRQQMTHAFVCSPLHAVMNFGFVALGVCVLGGVALLWPVWPRRRLVTGGLLLIGLFGAGKIVVGLAPEDAAPGLHVLGALGIPLGGIGILLVGTGTLRVWPGAAIISICVGAVSLAGIVLLVVAPGLGVGAMERVGDYPLPAWLALLGLSLLLRADSLLHRPSAGRRRQRRLI